MDHQESLRASGNNNGDIPSRPTESLTSTSTIPNPPTIHRSARTNKGVPCRHADEDPTLEIGSRPMARRDIQNNNPSVGKRGRNTHEGNPPTHTDDEDTGAAFLTADAPHSYQEAMDQPDADKWVEAIVEEYNNLEQKGVFVKVGCPADAHVHEGQLVFAEKVGSDGDITRKKVRLVTKGYMEIWGEDYWHTYSPTLGCNTLFACLAYAATLNLEIHQMDAVAAVGRILVRCKTMFGLMGTPSGGHR